MVPAWHTRAGRRRSPRGVRSPRRMRDRRRSAARSTTGKPSTTSSWAGLQSNRRWRIPSGVTTLPCSSRSPRSGWSVRSPSAVPSSSRAGRPAPSISSRRVPSRRPSRTRLARQRRPRPPSASDQVSCAPSGSVPRPPRRTGHPSALPPDAMVFVAQQSRYRWPCAGTCPMVLPEQRTGESGQGRWDSADLLFWRTGRAIAVSGPWRRIRCGATPTSARRPLRAHRPASGRCGRGRARRARRTRARPCRARGRGRAARRPSTGRPCRSSTHNDARSAAISARSASMP